ncbi:MAG: tetratricopeptide repeat protein [Bacteriovorax sp.]|jgi:TPR repeat protein
MGFQDHINNMHAAKSQIINFFEPKTKTQSSSTSQSSSRFKDLNQLEDLVAKKKPLAQVVHKCRVLFNKVLPERFQLNRNDYDEINLTQEQLFQDEGTYSNVEFITFRNHLEKMGAEYAPLKDAVGSYIPVTRGKFHFMRSTRERSQLMKAGVSGLKPGESILIDAQSCNPGKSGHAMIMRFTRNNDGTFKMEFANTGVGIDNIKFHPKSLSEPHKYQTIACINNIPSEKLLGDDCHFFETYSSIADGGGIPIRSCLTDQLKLQAGFNLKTNENESISGRIEALYLCLETLGEPEKADEKSNYYSRPQIGGSCAFSSLWAISKIILPKELITGMEADTKLKSLLRNYKLIENGYDQSSTRKIMVLDQVESLKHIYRDDQNVVQQLKKIETKLKKKLEVDRVESKVVGGVQLKDKLISEKTSSGEFSVRSMRGKLTPRKGVLVMDVKWEEAPKGSIGYNIKEVAPNHFKGIDRLDSQFLLYFAIANGDQKSCKEYIQQVLSQPSEHLSLAKNHEIQLCLSGLINDLSSSNTRSDIAKKYFLGLLMESNNPSYSMGEALKSRYVAMDVEAHLTTDNIWVNGINVLLERREAEFQKQLVDLGTPEAIYNAAQGKSSNRVLYRKLLKAAADLGHLESQYALGSDYWMKRELKEAIKYLKLAADQGNVYAQFKMGCAYERGALDIETSMKYSQMAADQGHENSISILKRLKLKRDELNGTTSI